MSQNTIAAALLEHCQVLRQPGEEREAFFTRCTKRLVASGILGTGFPAIYMNDLDQGDPGRDAWNWHVPVAIRDKDASAFHTMVLLQSERRRQVRNFSFSDFIFKAIPRKCVVVFHRGADNSVVYTAGDPVGKLLVSVKVEAEVVPGNSPVAAGNDFLNTWSMDTFQAQLTPPVTWARVEGCLSPVEAIKAELNSKLQSADLLTEFIKDHVENISKVIVSSLAVQGIYGFHYIPSVIRSELGADGIKRDLSSGGFIVPIFSEAEMLSSEQEQLLSIIAQRWFAQTAISDFAVRQSRAVRREAMRAGVSRVMGRSLSHTHGSNSFQRVSRPGTLRASLDHDDVTNAGVDRGAILIKAIEDRVAKSEKRNPKAAELITSLAAIAQRLKEKPIITEKAEEKLRGLFAYMKDRMELLAQIATSRSGLLEAEQIDQVFAEYDGMRLLTDHMVTERFTVKPVNCDSTERIGFVEGPIGKSALYSVVEGIVRNANRHTDLEDCELMVSAEQCPQDHLIKVTIGHPWMPRTSQKVALANIRSHLEKDMLDEKGGIRRGGWGLLEMKLACAFLREYDLVEVDDKEISPPLLAVEPSRVARKTYLNYVLYMPLPRACVVARTKEDGTIGYHSPDGEVQKQYVRRFPIIGVESGTTLDLEAAKLPQRSVVIELDKSDEIAIWKAYWSAHFKDVAVQVALFNEGTLVTSDAADKASMVVGTGKPAFVCAIHNHVKANGAKTRRDPREVMEQVIGGAHFKHLIQPIKDELSGGSPGIWAYRLAEAALTPIVVLDERIQTAAEHSVHPGGDDLYALLSQMGIYVPKRKEVDLDAPVHAHLVKYLKGIRAIKWHKKVPARYLVVHRTVLEKLSGKVGSTSPGEYVDTHFKGFVTRWTSGASAGEGVDKLSQVYVPFAMVERNTIGYPCKWQLTDMMIRASQL